MPSADDWSTIKHIAEAMGSPAAIIVVVIFLGRRFANWAAPMVQQLIDRHIQFTRAIEDTQGKIQQSIELNTSATHSVRVSVDKLGEKLTEHDAKLAQHDAKLHGNK